MFIQQDGSKLYKPNHDILSANMRTVSGIPVNGTGIVTDSIELPPGKYIVTLQMNGFQSTGPKWIGIEHDAGNIYGIINLSGVYGGICTTIVSFSIPSSVFGFFINYSSDISSYNTHHNDHFTAIRIGDWG